jgi:hypothetical protein
MILFKGFHKKKKRDKNGNCKMWGEEQKLLSWEGWEESTTERKALLLWSLCSGSSAPPTLRLHHQETQ